MSHIDLFLGWLPPVITNTPADSRRETLSRRILHLRVKSPLSAGVISPLLGVDPLVVGGVVRPAIGQYRVANGVVVAPLLGASLFDTLVVEMAAAITMTRSTPL